MEFGKNYLYGTLFDRIEEIKKEIKKLKDTEDEDEKKKSRDLASEKSRLIDRINDKTYVFVGLPCKILEGDSFKILD